MASSAKKGMGESSSAAQAGPLKAAVGSECPICLGAARRPAFVAYCMHQFCFRCIWHWARGREDCLVCQQTLEQVLHSVRGKNDYDLFVVGLPTCLCRRLAMDRARSCRPQHSYNLHKRPATNPPAAGQREPKDTGSSQGQGAAPGPSRAPAQLAPATSASWEPTCRTGPGAPPNPDDGQE